MPLNTIRLNHAASSHPNDRIVFIKPLPRPPPQASDYETADTLLRAIAAQCLPIMKSHYLSVTTLEEHEPNSEFIGRNFNNGEIIQLVLRGKNGGWLPVNMIQMVMMHELAHNVHMNHSRKFWETRNLFAEEMRALWSRGYTGEGFWGSGRTLSQLGDVMGGNTARSEELKDVPVCGGTFRSRRKKRKSKNEGSTWKEKKERRIEKKFGKNGVSLGEDEGKRLSLDLAAKGPMGVKPRVAQSKRGRELRVAAALARFETNKKEVDELDRVKTEDNTTHSEDDYEDADADQEDARDTDGNKMLDRHGHGMIKICEEEDVDDTHVKREMEELSGLDYKPFTSNNRTNGTSSSNRASSSTKPTRAPKSLYDIPQYQDNSLSPPQSSLPMASPSLNTNTTKTTPKITIHPSRSQPQSQPHPVSQIATSSSTSSASELTTTSVSTPALLPPSRPITTLCPICSLTNPVHNPTCTACAHVLDRRKDPRAWVCASETCKESVAAYVNAGDVGVCGICWERRNG